MNRRVLKYPVVAALFSAAFLFGVSPADAYTYSGVSINGSSLSPAGQEDITVTNKSNIKLSETINLVDTTSTTKNVFSGDGKIALGWLWYIGETETTYGNIETDFITARPTQDEVDKANNRWNTKGDRLYSSSIYFTNIKNPFFLDESGYLCISDDFDKYAAVWYTEDEFWKEANGQWDEIENDGWTVYVYSGNIELNTETYQLNRGLTVSENSVLNCKSNIYTTKFINVLNSASILTDASITAKTISVTNNSFLKADGSISGENIYSDRAIISSTKDSGESVLAAGNIKATGALKSDTYIGAWSGAVSGNTVYSGGNVVSANSIKAGGKAKGNALNVAAINAASASITGNQTISGIFTTTGQAKLNGGAALGSKKITGLGAGTLSGTSTEAVNGAQLYTITQKLASVGKSYTAGSDIAISSANAISVSKTGAVKSGDTGIVTGGTVYTETNSLNTKLNGLKDLVNSHQTTISSLQQQMGDLNQTISDINSNVASATSNLSNQLKNCLKSDMGNLSAAGRTAIKNIVSDSLKSMGRQSSQTLTSPIATFAAPDVKDMVNAKDVESVHTALADKLNKAALSDITATVDANTKQITSNINNIHSNASSIESLKSGKSDVSGSNIDIAAYASKLGTGIVAKGDRGLVSGDTVYGALDKKVDISYVDSGIGMMENQMEGIRQQATHDMNRVGAGASALAGLHPSVYDASDKLSFASGYGHYKNANTSALGAFYHPNKKTMVSVASTIGNNNTMLSAGVSIKLGMSDHVSKVMVTPKMFSTQQVTNENMKDHIDTQSERLHQIEMAIQNR